MSAATSTLLKTPLYDWHVAHGGRMVDFAGWSMPVQYKSITAEHLASRKAVGVFDISHMGRLQVFGSDSAGFVDGLVTRRVADMRTGQVRYGLVTNEGGGILDDVLVYRLGPDEVANDDQPALQLVVNASNRAKIVDWLAARQTAAKAVRIDDVTERTAMLAVQGPFAVRLVQEMVDCPLTALRYYTGCYARLAGTEAFLSRTGYTGEDGFEIICNQGPALDVWRRIIDAAKSVGGMAVGLGARDTLRLEAGMPLYGHELTEDINPIQAGLSFAVTLGGREFVGRTAIEAATQDTRQPVRIGMQLDGRRVPRQGCAIFYGEEEAGHVTSGTFSPTFERPIAMGYVRPSASAVGTRLAVDIRGTSYPAVVVPLPFYRRGG